ncbi:MAG: hypothetical protein ABI594_02085 [Ginsengibacter sp.]
MFVKGQLLYFTPFYFKNGNDPKNKFFLILRNIGNITIVASLPTKVNNAPSLMDDSHGCINHDERKFNCYVFAKNKPICNNGFSVDLTTHIYGDQIDEYLIEEITDFNSIMEGRDYETRGMLTEEELKGIKDCVQNSKSVIGRVKRLLFK